MLKEVEYETQPGGTGGKMAGCVESRGRRRRHTVVLLQRCVGIFIYTHISMPLSTC